MSELFNGNINSLTNKVTELKGRLIENLTSDAANQCNSNDKNSLKILRQMRVLHGAAEMKHFVEKAKLMDKQNISEEDLIKLSNDSSLIHVIHCHIRKCEKGMYNKKINADGSVPAILTTESDNSDSGNNSKETSFQTATKNNKSVFDKNTKAKLTEMKNNITAKIKKSATGTEELSIANPNLTDTETQNSIFSESMPKIKYSPGNTSDYVNNLSTSEANKLQTNIDGNKTVNDILEYPQKLFEKAKEFLDQNLPSKTNMSGGQADNVEKDINKPTIVNYWADWCGYSNRFSPVWEQFKATASTKYPNLQIDELNVEKDEKKVNIAKMAGVNGYPTIVIFKDGQKYSKPAGNMTIEKLQSFVQETLNK